jgi:hypothetical protein
MRSPALDIIGTENLHLVNKSKLIGRFLLGAHVLLADIPQHNCPASYACGGLPHSEISLPPTDNGIFLR